MVPVLVDHKIFVKCNLLFALAGADDARIDQLFPAFIVALVLNHDDLANLPLHLPLFVLLGLSLLLEIYGFPLLLFQPLYLPSEPGLHLFAVVLLGWAVAARCLSIFELVLAQQHEVLHAFAHSHLFLDLLGVSVADMDACSSLLACSPNLIEDLALVEFFDVETTAVSVVVGGFVHSIITNRNR